MSRGIPKYCRHNVRDLGYVNFKGKRYYLPGKLDSVESLNAYHEFLRKNVLVNYQPPADPQALTITGLVRAYMHFADDHYEDKGHQSHWKLMHIICLKLEAEYGSTKATDFGPKLLKEFRKSLIESGNSRDYINSEIGRIRKVFKWAASEELIPVTVYEALKTVDGIARGRMGVPDRPKRQPAVWDDVETIAKAIHQPIRDMIYFQWHTGQRSMAITAAHADQFTADDDGTLIWQPRHKTEWLDKVVRIPLGPKATAIIASRLAAGGLLFPTKQGKAYRTWTYRRAIVRKQEQLFAAATEKHREDPEKHPAPRQISWTPHMLRHAKGHHLRNTYGIEAAQALLGHDSLQATQVYSEARFLLAKEIAQKEG